MNHTTSLLIRAKRALDVLKALNSLDTAVDALEREAQRQFNAKNSLLQP